MGAALLLEPSSWVTSALTNATTAASASADAPTMPSSRRRDCVGGGYGGRWSGCAPVAGKSRVGDVAAGGGGVGGGGLDAAGPGAPVTAALAASASSIADW